MSNDLREELENAIAEADGLEVSEPDTEIEVDIDGENEATETQETETHTGGETPPETDSEAANLADEGDASPEGVEQAGEKTDEPKTKQDLKAPQSWTPKARENWSKLPVDVQKEISEREQQMNEYLQSTAQERKLAQEFQQTIQPFQHQLGDNPTQAIGNILGTVNQLTTGDTQTKASVIANLIKEYGVDINSLDNAIVEMQSADPAIQQQQQIQQLVQQQVQPVLSLFEQQQQALIAKQQEQYNEQVANFQGEFFNDVRLEMADFMDVAEAQGRQLSLEEAYNMAVAARPDIQQVIQQREQQSKVLGEQQKLNTKKAASSSLDPASGSDGEKELSLRQELERQFS